jgi:Icc-related predicted phosphoesterase
MRLLVLSDLHLEIWRDFAPRFDIHANRPDVVVLAGDIHTKARAPSWAAQTFPEIPVMYVSGNHEFYGEALDQMGEAIRVECEKYSNVHYLDCKEYVLQGVRFLGMTLWTDFLLFGTDLKRDVMVDAGKVMNDYQRIRVASAGYRNLRPQDTAQLHGEQRSWLQGKLLESFPGPTVVITHMAPSRRSVSPEYASDPVSSAFVSDLDELVTLATLWIHGHTHTSFDYSVGQCRVVANPLGYMMRGGHAENDDFDPNFIVELSC